MLTLPPLPSWQAIHPLIVHFPIALLLIAPLFIVIGVMWKPNASFPFLLVALMLMALGTASTFIAAASGEAAGDLADQDSTVKAVLEQHEDLAENTEIIFSALTLIFAAILFVPRLLRRERNRAIATILPLVFMVFYATGAISLVNTAHQGGRLVHELGVRAQMRPRAVAVESAEHE
jgi:uncharacterized membrane protein